MLEQGRARLLLESIERDRSNLHDLIDLGRPDLYNAYGRLVERMHSPEYAEIHSSKQPRERSRGKEMQQAREEFSALLSDIRQVPGYQSFLERPDVLKLWESVVDHTTAGVYLCTTIVGSVALVMREKDIVPVWLDVTSIDLANLLGSLDPSGNESPFAFFTDESSSSLFSRSLESLLPQIGMLVMAPLASVLDRLGVTSVYIVATGLLGLLPIAASSYTINDRVHVFAHDFVVSFVPSIQILEVCQRRLMRVASTKASFFGIGSSTSVVGDEHPLLSHLEINLVSRYFETTQSSLDAGINWNALANLLAGSSHTHFACHGDYFPNEPLNSCLYHSELIRTTVAEIASGPRLDGSRLVVLSACRTALTDISQLPEECRGLPAAFLEAGTAGVIGTLWRVDDIATATLMTKFYELHIESGLAPARALGLAQEWVSELSYAELFEFLEQQIDRKPPFLDRDLIEQIWQEIRDHVVSVPSERPFRRPWYWAGFAHWGV